MTQEFEPIDQERAYRKVASALIARITDRSLEVGERLPSETELARQFGVNRGTVREAMRELESDGLIGRERGSKLMTIRKPAHQLVGVGVSRALALHDVTFFDVWEALTFLEPSLAEVAAKRRTAANLKRLLEAAQRFKTDNENALTAVGHVVAFFREIGESTHNPVLALAQEPLIQLLAPSLRSMIDRVPQARARISTAQSRLYDAINARESQVAANWMAKHIRDFKKGYEVAQISLQDTVAGIDPNPHRP